MFRLILGSCLLLATAASPRVADAGDPYVVAHRGLLRYAPENTLANFRACLNLRIGFEFDVSRTRDGKLVCIHDSTVDRTTNGSGKVAAMRLEELRGLDAGSWFSPSFAGEQIPTIAEVFALLKEHRDADVLLAVDLKDPTAGADTARLALRYNVIDRLLFIGQTIRSSEVRDAIRKAAPAAHTAALANRPSEVPAALAAKNADWAYIRFVPSAQQVKAIHRAGKRVFIAGPTVSGMNPANWQRVWKAGVNGILTDFPLALRHQIRGGDSAAGRTVPVKARLIARKKRYELPRSQQGAAFRRRIESEKDPAKLPPAQKVDLVLELRNVSDQNVMIWPRGAITSPDLRVKGPGIVEPKSLGGASGSSSGTSVQPTIAPGKTHRIPITSLNPGEGTPFVYWSRPGKYLLQASYTVYTGLPPFPFPAGATRAQKTTGSPRRYVVTTPPITVEVVPAR